MKALCTSEGVLSSEVFRRADFQACVPTQILESFVLTTIIVILFLVNP